MTWVMHHAIMDNTAARALWGDLTALLRGDQPGEKVEWSLFSNVYRRYSTSLPAEENLSIHLKRLKGIQAFRASFWSRLNEPSARSMCLSEQDKSQSLEAVEDQNCVVQCSRTRRIPNTEACRIELKVRPAIVTKAAIALFNCHSTQTFTAFLAVALSGRAWPYIDPSIARFLPDARKIAGPTLSMCTDIIRLDPEETIVNMLKRLGEEQRLISQYSHCPLSIIERFSVEDRAVWALARKQIFNWLPFGQKHNQLDGNPLLTMVYDKSSKIDEEIDEFTWRCNMLDEEQLKIEVHASSKIFEASELETIIDQVFDYAGKLTDRENWTRSVGSLFFF